MRTFILSVWWDGGSAAVNLGRWNYSSDPSGCLARVAEVALRQARKVAPAPLAPYWPDYWPTRSAPSAWLEASDGFGRGARACLSMTPFDN